AGGGARSSRASSALPGARCCPPSSVVVFQAAQQLGLAALQFGLAGAGGAEPGGLVAGHVLQHPFGLLAGAVLGLHRHPQALGLLGRGLGLHPQPLGLGAGAGGLLAAGPDPQAGALAVELVDLAPEDLGAGRDLGRLHPPLGHSQRGVALAGARRAQGLQGLAGLQALEVGEGVAGRIRVDRAQPFGQALGVGVRLVLRQGRRGGGHGRQPQGKRDVPDHAHGSIPSCSRRREIWARRWASSVLATASRLRARARSAAAAAATAAVRASRWLPPDMADWAWDSSARAWSSSAGAYWSASASAARATACWAAESSAVGGGVLAQAVSASTVPTISACRIERNCAMLAGIGGRIVGEQAVIVGSKAPGRNDRARVKGGSFMDIGYFLKLMTEKNASNMFLTTGAPVHIKVEGKLYPLGNTGLPAGMVKKIAYSLMDEGQVPQFERDLEFNMAIAVKDTGRFRVNVFKQRGEVGMVIRAIKSEIPTIDQLKLPEVLKDIVLEQRGLVLVVGSTGSGKSTTLAAMIDHRNSNTTGHI